MFFAGGFAGRYAVFSIWAGDSSYPDFNATATRLAVRLKQLGAREFYRMGLGDDMHDFEYESEFHPWTEGLWLPLASFLPVGECETGLLEPMFVVEDTETEPREEEGHEVLSNEPIGFEVSDSILLTLANQYDFNPGDTFEIRPPNGDEKV